MPANHIAKPIRKARKHPEVKPTPIDCSDLNLANFVPLDPNKPRGVLGNDFSHLRGGRATLSLERCKQQTLTPLK
jgi:hypothetical protein